MDKFNTLLNATSWDDFYSIPDQALTILFYKIFNEAFEKSFPLVKLFQKQAEDEK